MVPTVQYAFYIACAVSDIQAHGIGGGMVWQVGGGLKAMVLNS